MKVPQGIGINRYRVCEAREVENARTENYMSVRLACVQGGKSRKNQTPGDGCGLQRGLGSILKLTTSGVFLGSAPHSAGHMVLCSLPPSCASEAG